MQINEQISGNLTLEEILKRINDIQCQHSIFTSNVLALTRSNNNNENLNEILELYNDTTTDFNKDKEEKTLLNFLKKKKTTEVLTPEELHELEKQFYIIVENASSSKITLEIDIKLYEELHKELIIYHEQISILITLLDDKIKELKTQAINSNEDPNTPNIGNLEQKLYDLKTTKQLILQSIAYIKLMQDNNRIILLQLDKILNHVVPASNLGITLSLGIEKQNYILRTEKAISNLSTASLEQLSSNIENGKKLINNPDKLKEAMKEIRNCILPIKEVIEKDEKGIVLKLTNNQGDNHE